MLNLVEAIGWLGADPKSMVYEGDTQTTKTSFRVGTTVYKKPPKESTTMWFNVVAFGKQAEYAAKNFKKGSLVRVLGTLEVREYTNKDGNPASIMELKAERVHSL